MPFLSHHSLICESLQASSRASEMDWEAEAALAATELLKAANWLLAMRELRRTDAISLSREEGCGTGMPRSSHHDLRSDSDQLS